MRTRKAGIAMVAVLATVCPGIAACSGSTPSGTIAPSAPAPVPPTVTTSNADNPALKVDQVAAGLEHGWDIGFLPDGKLLVTQRPGRLALVAGTAPGSAVKTVAADFSDVLVQGEGGLMGLVVHPDFEQSRQFTTCQTHKENGKAVDIRLVTWALSPDEASAAKVADLLTGLPVNPSGRHSGCRPVLAPDGALMVGTGDTAQPAMAQDRHNLGGKVLRIDLKTGNPLPGNPFLSSADPKEQRIYTYGHRNVQGIAVQPGTGRVFTAEHGPTFDDEVNILQAGGNYGWDPSKGGTDKTYDESVSMTDTDRFPDAVHPLWTTGKITEAICGAAFLTGKQWGPIEGMLAVVALKGQKMLLLRVNDAGALVELRLPPEFDEKYGRLRAARTGPDGALYVTTSDGSNDKLLRVTPA